MFQLEGGLTICLYNMLVFGLFSEVDTTIDMVCFRFTVATTTVKYNLRISPISPDWFHMAIVYLGPNDGISVYLNGSFFKSDTSGTHDPHGNTSGNIIIGKGCVSDQWKYAVSLDELYFWNERIGVDLLETLYNAQK